MDAKQYVWWILFFSILSLYLSAKAILKRLNKSTGHNLRKAFSLKRKARKNSVPVKKTKTNLVRRVFKNIQAQKEAQQKGNASEVALYKILSARFGKEQVFHNLYIKKSENDYAQIDILALTPIGIIVFEVKNYSGWIFADGKSRNWMKILNYGREKYPFYNPFFQNAGHIRALQKQFLNFPHLNFYSVVVFDGGCELKSLKNLEPKTFVIYMSEVKYFLGQILKREKKTPYNRELIAKILNEAKRNSRDPKIIKAHLNKVKNLQQVKR